MGPSALIALETPASLLYVPMNHLLSVYQTFAEAAMPCGTEVVLMSPVNASLSVSFLTAQSCFLCL